MSFFNEVKRQIGRVVRKIFSKKLTIQKAYEDVEIILSSEMENSIQTWKELYRGCPPWLNDETKTMNIPVAIADEFARVATMEMDTSVQGDSAMATFLNDQYQKVVQKAQHYTEFACAKGGIVLKPYVVPVTNSIEVSIIQADEFYITNYEDNGRILGAIFPDQKIRNGKKYTRLERHELVGTHYVIENKLFVTDVMDASEVKDSDFLGKEIELSAVPEWAEIQPRVELENIDKPLFAYLKMPFANNIDEKSPIGISVYSRAIELFKEADEQYSRILWEYKATEAAVFADEEILHHDNFGNIKLEGSEKRLYRKLEGFEKQLEEFNPEIRSDPLFKGLNEILKKIEFLCHLAFGTISDPQLVEKTATEIKSSKQRSFVTIAKIQDRIKNAHEDLVYAMYALASLYNLSASGEYTVIHDFGDNIDTDREAEFKRRMAMAAAGMLKPELVVSWYFKCTEKEALEMMPGDLSEVLEEEGPEEE